MKIDYLYYYIVIKIKMEDIENASKDVVENLNMIKQIASDSFQKISNLQKENEYLKKTLSDMFVKGTEENSDAFELERLKKRITLAKTLAKDIFERMIGGRSYYVTAHGDSISPELLEKDLEQNQILKKRSKWQNLLA